MNESLKYEIMVLTKIEIQKRGTFTISLVQSNNWYNCGENYILLMILLILLLTPSVFINSVVMGPYAKSYVQFNL